MATTEEFKVKVTATGLENLDKVSKGAEVAKAKIDGLATAILGVGFGAFIHGAMEMADRISDLSDATGISIAKIKGFEDALGAAGGKSRNAEKAILSFVTAIETANDGSLKVRDAFAAVGVSLSDLRNLSEQDLLLKTINGLKNMEEGSARTTVQATLLSKAFRGVDAKKFFDEFVSGAINAEQLAEKLRIAGDRVDQMEKQFKTLQEGALIAMAPILSMLGGTELNAEAAAKGITVVGVALGLAFGAQMLGKIVALNAAILNTALISNLLGKNPLIRLLAGTALLVAEGALGWTAYEVAMAKVEEQQQKLTDSIKTGDKILEGSGKGTAGRTQEMDARQKALAESQKRIQQSLAESRKNSELSTTDEIKNIRLTAETDIVKAIEEINAREYLTRAQKDKEIAAKRTEVESKAEYDIAKVKEEVNKQLQDQLSGLKRTTEEKQAQFDLEKSMLGSGSQSLELGKQLLDIENNRKKAIEEAARIKNIDPGQLAAQIEQINTLAETQKTVAEQNYEYQRTFEKGWQDAFANYVENGTNAAKIAGDMFNSFTGNMNSALDKFVTTGKFSFGDLARSIIIDLEKIALKAAAVQLFKTAFAGTSFGSMFGFAEGGYIPTNAPVLVGENGPEIISGAAGKYVTPNSQISNFGPSPVASAGLGSSAGGGGNTYITNNISAIDAKGVAQLFYENRLTLFGTVQQAQKELPGRPGMAMGGGM